MLLLLNLILAVSSVAAAALIGLGWETRDRRSNRLTAIGKTAAIVLLLALCAGITKEAVNYYQTEAKRAQAQKNIDTARRERDDLRNKLAAMETKLLMQAALATAQRVSLQQQFAAQSNLSCGDGWVRFKRHEENSQSNAKKRVSKRFRL